MFMIHKQVIIFFYYKITYTIFYVYCKNVEMCYNIRYAIGSSLERSITMNTYQTFEEYIYDKYYDTIYNKIKNFVFGNETHRCSQLNSLQMSLLLNWTITV